MKTVLITGCSSGIGLSTALLLKEQGYRVFATARSEKDVLKLQNLGFESFLIDVTKYETIHQALDEILELTNGTLDVVFNNAGFGQPGAVEDLKTEVLKNQFETNVFGLHELTQAVVPIMRKQGHGKIIQHSSVLGLISLKYRGAYNASKYAIEGLTDTLRLELEDSNIFVSLLNTGPITSNFRQNALAMFKKNIDASNSFHQDAYNQQLSERLNSKEATVPFTLEPIAVSNIVLKIIKSSRPRPRYYITTATHLLGFCKRILPTRWLDLILKRM